MLRIAPGAAWAVKAIGLVGFEQGTGAGYWCAGFQQSLANAFQHAPQPPAAEDALPMKSILPMNVVFPKQLFFEALSFFACRYRKTAEHFLRDMLERNSCAFLVALLHS